MLRLTVILVIISASCVLAKYNFKFGRPRNGFLSHEPFADNFGENINTTSNKHIKIKWFEQKLDHFREDNRMWEQKYWINDQFYKPGGPVFLMIGGEGATYEFWINPDDPRGSHDWLRNAERFGALCIQLEHRFYGASHPLPDTSNDNMQYLNTQQALADTANFISQMNIKLEISNPKWVAFGGSYPGQLAVWLRLKYPHLVIGSVGSSAPVLARVNFKEYFLVVHDALTEYDPKCDETVQNATKMIQKMMGDSAGRTTIKQKLNLCQEVDPTNEIDVMNFYNDLAQTMAGIVQYSEDNRGQAATTRNVPNVCDGLLDEEAVPDLLDRYYQKFLVVMNGNECMDISYDNFINFLKMTEFGATDGYRQWFFQACSEWGYLQSSDDPSQPFGQDFGIDFQLRQCRDAYGEKFTADYTAAGVAATNNYYGGTDVKESNIVFPNGSTDPWHKLGVLVTENPRSPARYMHGRAHCSDMYPPRKEDPETLNETRKLIIESLASWLSEEHI